MSGFMNKLFGKPAPPPKTPAETAREWKHGLNAEQRGMDRQMRKIQQAMAKAKVEAKKAAKVNELGAVRIFAKEILHGQKTIKRMQVTKTMLNSVKMQIDLQVAQIKVTGSLQKSSEVMATMSGLVRIGDISQTMQDMSREMMKFGLIDEMVEESMGGIMDDVSDTEADEEVNKVVEDLMSEKMTGTRVNTTKLPAQEVAVEEEPNLEDEAGDDELMAKFNAMKAA